jgi:hypothetical protein
MPVVVMRSLALVALLALPPSVAAAGQTPSRPEKEKKTAEVTVAFAAKLVEAWTTAVRTHVAGTIDEPLKTVASWKPEYVTMVVRLVSGRLNRQPGARERLLRTVDAAGVPADAAELTRTLARGLSLHTDIAIVERNTDAPPDSLSAVVLVDGQVTRYVRRSAHWAIARQIAADVAPQPGYGPRVAEWYRATAGLMQEWGDCDLAGPHLETGQALFPDDPVLALYQGTLRQTFGDPRLSEYLQKRRSTEGLGRAPVASRSGPPATGPARLSNVTKVELGIARRELQRAVTLDPALHEARIRLAHVLSELGNDREAADVVRPALEAELPPFLEFYAALILGRSEEQLGRFDEAGVAYTRAAARFPGAESAEVGRSRVALAQGRAPDALKILVDAIGPYSTEQPDPWLDYLKRHDPDSDTLLKAWRAGVK